VLVALSKNAKGGAWQNKQRDLMDVAELLGWYEEGMTAEGKKPPKKWAKGDIVVVKFNEDNREWFESCRVKTCESSHKKLNDGANITCQPMSQWERGATSTSVTRTPLTSICRLYSQVSPLVSSSLSVATHQARIN
jgi:hypothetical protein